MMDELCFQAVPSSQPRRRNILENFSGSFGSAFTSWDELSKSYPRLMILGECVSDK